MLFDVDAAVIENRRLSEHYSVLVLDAPAIAAATQPGQFVMIKPRARPIRCCGGRSRCSKSFATRDGTPSGHLDPEQAHRRGHDLLYERRAGRRDCGASGRSAVRSNRSTPPAEAWMVAGGVGLAPFVTLASRCRARHADDAVLRRAHGRRSSTTLDLFERSACTWSSRPKTAARGVTDASPCRSMRALRERPRGQPVKLYVCGPTPMMRACAHLAPSTAAPATCRWNR